MKIFKNKHWILYLIFFLIAIAGIFVHAALWKVNPLIEEEDIYYSFVEGRRLAQGVNPYERVLLGDMHTNDKYATYFPLFYILSGCTQLLGLRNFPEWLTFWRVIFLGFNLSICYLIFRICDDKGQPLLGIFAVLFWLFNRWTLHLTAIAHIDFIPLFLLLLSLILLPRRFYLACILFGLSLSIKQIAIFALPVYLIWSWRTNRQDRLKNTLVTFTLIISIPLLLSLPFLIWNSKGYIKSILFSVTRYPSDHFQAPSLDAWFGYYGILAKIPMLFLMGLTYVLIWRRRIPVYASLLLIMTVFFCFHSVLFRQYIIWFLLFIPLTIGEIINAGRGAAQIPDSEPITKQSLHTDEDCTTLHPHQ